MFAVYRYVDIDDCITKYIGIVRGGSISARHSNHISQDNWCTARMQLKYIILSSISEAEAFESHFIAYYQTYNFFNKDKSDWGINSFLPYFEECEWLIYNYPNDYFNIHKTLTRKQETNAKKILLYLNSLENGVIFKVADLLNYVGLDHKQFSKVREKNSKINEMFHLMAYDKRGYYKVNRELLKYD